MSRGIGTATGLVIGRPLPTPRADLRTRLRGVLVVALLGSTLWAAPAFAQCGGTQLCAAGAGDCTVSANCTITVPAGGLVIDLGTRKLVITKTLTVVGPSAADLTINCGSLLLNGGTIIFPGTPDAMGQVSAGNVFINAATDITVQNNALIDVSAPDAAGLVDLEAIAGTMSFSGRIKANGTTRLGGGGDVTLTAFGNLNANGSTIDTSGGDQSFGGSITLTSLTGSAVVGVPLNTAGGDGGDIDVGAGTSIQMTSAAAMTSGANGDAGSGGDIDIEAVGDVTVGGATTSKGSPAASSEDQQSGGDGGSFTIFSDTGSVAVNGTIDLSGAAAGGGGDIDIDAGADLTFSKQMVTAGQGVDGFGGNVTLAAVGNLSMPQQVNASAGPGSGGTIDAFTSGLLTVSASLLTDGALDAGTITLQGCTVNITKPALLSAQGAGVAPAGTNIVRASTGLTVAGTLKASLQNKFDWRTTAPSILGTASITPAAVVVQNLSLPCCGVSCTTTTTTSTTTSSTSTSTSTTTVHSTTSTSSPTPTTSIPGASTSSTSTSTTTTTPSTTSTSSSTTTSSSSTSTSTSTSSTSSSTSTSTTTTRPSTTSTSSSTSSSTTTTTLVLGCTNGPKSGCGAAAKTYVLVNEKSFGKEKVKLVIDRLIAPVTAAQFGDPVGGSTSYAVCLYDGSDKLIATMRVNRAGSFCGTKPCWKALDDKGFKYSDKETQADGIQQILVKAGDAGKGKIVIKGKNDLPHNHTSLPVGVALKLAGDRHATVQVLSNNAACFSGIATSVSQADGEVFKGTAP